MTGRGPTPNALSPKCCGRKGTSVNSTDPPMGIVRRHESRSLPEEEDLQTNVLGLIGAHFHIYFSCRALTRAPPINGTQRPTGILHYNFNQIIFIAAWQFKRVFGFWQKIASATWTPLCSCSITSFAGTVSVGQFEDHGYHPILLCEI